MDSESDPMGEVSTMPFAPPPTPASAPPSVKRHPVDEEEGGKRTKALRVPSTNNENKGLLPLLSAKEQVNDDLISSELADFREKMLACVEHFCQYFGQTRRAEQDELRQMFLGVRQDAQLLRDALLKEKGEMIGKLSGLTRWIQHGPESRAGGGDQQHVGAMATALDSFENPQ
eukprot:m.120577 g.120577  ORF g.120577 m.120577 type:complete len:173 (-) comp14559_c0_seq1:192-710(-)